MSIQAITMPKWGLAMMEGMVTEWHVNVGDTVARGEEAVDIETEKITNVFETPVGGVLRRQLVEVGETVPVGALLGVVADADESETEVDAFIEAFNREFARTLAAREAQTESGPEPEALDVHGRAMRYLAIGEGDATPLLLLHGFGGDLNNWLFNQPVLAEHRPVYALDLPGHGGSTKTLQGASVAALAEDVAAFVATAELTSIHVAGHSLGGCIAIQLALQQPDLVCSLSLIASAGLGPDIDMEYIDGFIDSARRKDLKPVAERLFADPGLVNREMLDDILKFKRLDGVQALLRELADTVFAGGRQAAILREDLARLDKPCQLIWGSEDRIVPAHHAQGLPDHITVTTIDNAGHMVHMEHASRVNELLNSFLAEH